MIFQRPLRTTLVLVTCFALAACGGGVGNAFRLSAGGDTQDEGIPNSTPKVHNPDTSPQNYEKSSIWDVFGGNKGDQTVNVNRYLWSASLDVLSFLPVESVDPFTGVIVTGFGKPPGGGRAYRATVHVSDPALDARSLNVSLHTHGGPVSASTTRAVEDAILARARQIRIGDKKL